MAVWPLNSLIPLEEEKNRAMSWAVFAAGSSWLIKVQSVVLIEREDRYYGSRYSHGVFFAVP
jgi:hypothetical protein